MNQEIKDLWISTLLSGEYTQGKRRLRKNLNGIESYCCLGVLCDLYHKGTGKGKWEKSNMAPEHLIFYDEDNNYSHVILPKKVIEWSGLRDQNPAYEMQTKSIGLANLNDGGSTFTEIAEAIKEYF